MAVNPLVHVLEAVRAAGHEVGPGLSANERHRIESALGLTVPPDFAELLELGVPSGGRFPDWHGGPDAIRPLVARPVEGLLFDVGHGLWLEAWGARPASEHDALSSAKEALAAAPPLVPVWAHRYLPTEPSKRGNPVLSVMQSDIVVYGADLADYFAREFGLARRSEASGTTRPASLPFWGQFLTDEGPP